MEPLTAGAIAIGTIIATKALEKTTEKGTDILLGKGVMSSNRPENRVKLESLAGQRLYQTLSQLIFHVSQVAKRR